MSAAVAQFKSRYREDTAAIALTGWETLAADAPAWVRALRLRGHEKVAALGLPTPKLERWKYTDLPSRLKKLDLKFTAAPLTVKGLDIPVRPLKAATSEKWMETWASAKPAGEEAYADMMLWQAANAFFRDGIVLDVPAGAVYEEPLEIYCQGQSGTYFNPRIFIRLGTGADLTVIEKHTGKGGFWNNAVTQIQIAKGAHLRHYRLQDNPQDAIYTQSTHIEIEQNASYRSFTLTTGSGLSRNQIHPVLKGRQADCHLSGLNLLNGPQIGDTTITMEHQAPCCTSTQMFRSILDGQAHGVFQGKVHVHQAAQKTDGYQISNALLFSPLAQMTTKPELEIYADDVKCSHGATTGRLDEQPLFYMRSRGIPEKQARLLLVEAFAEEIIATISHAETREDVQTRVRIWLEGALASGK